MICIRIVQRQQKKKISERKSKKCNKQLTPFELSEIIVEKGIRTRTEFVAFANKHKLEGKCNIAEFIVNRGALVAAKVLNTAREMTNVQDKLERSKKPSLNFCRKRQSEIA